MAPKYDRAYSDAERALYLQYREMRERYRPAMCNGGAQCWVEQGPPAYRATNTIGTCVGCHSKIKVPYR